LCSVVITKRYAASCGRSTTPFSPSLNGYLISRSAQPGIAADRFAREIIGFFDVIPCGALAAAECQAVGRLEVKGNGEFDYD